MSKEIIGTVGLLFVIIGIALFSYRIAMIVAGLLLFAYAYVTARVPRGTS